MASLGRYCLGGYRIVFAYRRTNRDAEDVLGQASQVESITRQNALTLDPATPFQHWRLLTDEDLQRWFPRRSGPLCYDLQVLLEADHGECALHCTSLELIRENTPRAAKFVDELGNLARLVAGIFFGLRRGELQYLLWSD